MITMRKCKCARWDQEQARLSGRRRSARSMQRGGALDRRDGPCTPSSPKKNGTGQPWTTRGAGQGQGGGGPAGAGKQGKKPACLLYLNPQGSSRSILHLTTGADVQGNSAGKPPAHPGPPAHGGAAGTAHHAKPDTGPAPNSALPQMDHPAAVAAEVGTG